jgi:dihydropteroate synthase
MSSWRQGNETFTNLSGWVAMTEKKETNLDYLRFNARVLGPGPEMAFSSEAQPLLEAALIPARPGAGGLCAAITPQDLEKLHDLPDSGLGRAVDQARKGWARTAYHWKLKEGRLLDLSCRPRLMGILNVTPDSFSDGGSFFSMAEAVAHGKAMARAGAVILDVGGESTRPGSEPVHTDEEIRRTVPVIEALSRETEALISIDTTKAKVAEAALEGGASIINDISGLAFDPAMAPLAARTGAGVVLMHIQGKPGNMQKNPFYEDTLAEVCAVLRARLAATLEAGIEPDRIVLDPGIGFGKRFEDNLRLLAGLSELRSLGFPLLLGVSRKAFLGTITGRDAPDRILETASVTVLAAQAGVPLLRVHDVAENRIALQVADAILQHGRPREPGPGKDLCNKPGKRRMK